MRAESGKRVVRTDALLTIREPTLYIAGRTTTGPARGASDGSGDEEAVHARKDAVRLASARLDLRERL